MEIKTKIVQIGNSRGIRIPKHILEAAGLQEEILVQIEDGKLVIKPAGHPREGWLEAFNRLADDGEDELVIDDTLPNQWDEEDWHWSSKTPAKF